MTSLTITKTGRVDFDEAIRVSGISLRSITMYQNVYNLTEATVYITTAGKQVDIPPGYYTYQRLRELMNYEFKVHTHTLKVSYEGTLTGGLKKRIDKKDMLYLTPLCLYVYVEGINESTNLLDGKRSDLLSIIPVDDTNVGEIFTHQPQNHFKKMYSNEIRALNVSIRDERGKDYTGKFVAELTLQ